MIKITAINLFYRHLAPIFFSLQYIITLTLDTIKNHRNTVILLLFNGYIFPAKNVRERDKMDIIITLLYLINGYIRYNKKSPQYSYFIVI